MFQKAPNSIENIAIIKDILQKGQMQHAHIKNPLLFFFMVALAFGTAIAAIYIAWKY